jgi:hypothetical protein
MGILEDSGLRQRDSSSWEMQVVWRLSPLGHLVAEYQALGLTVEQALATAKTRH